MSEAEKVHYWYRYTTSHGILGIIPQEGGRFKLMLGEEQLGIYNSPEDAAFDASEGTTDTLPAEVDLETLGIPSDIEDWRKDVFVRISRLRPA